jgi:hypothetical protein
MSKSPYEILGDQRKGVSGQCLPETFGVAASPSPASPAEVEPEAELTPEQRRRLREDIKALRPSPDSADVADYRHRCARSGLHAHDGCACTDADLIRRYAPIDAAGDTTPATGALPSSDGSKAQPLGAVASSPADDVAGLIKRTKKVAADLSRDIIRPHAAETILVAAAAVCELQSALTQRNVTVDILNAEVSRLQARLAEVTAELDFERGERRRVSDLCDETEHERAVADASAATMREALTEWWSRIARPIASMSVVIAGLTKREFDSDTVA